MVLTLKYFKFQSSNFWMVSMVRVDLFKAQIQDARFHVLDSMVSFQERIAYMRFQIVIFEI